MLGAQSLAFSHTRELNKKQIIIRISYMVENCEISAMSETYDLWNVTIYKASFLQSLQPHVGDFAN